MENGWTGFMAQDDFDQFRRVVFQDLALQAELREINDRREFIRRLIQIGSERGYAFVDKQVEEAMHANRRAWLERRT